MSVAALPTVTLVAVDTANHALALRALDRSRRDLAFARVLLITDRVPDGVAVPSGIDVASIAPLASRDEYSQFMLKSLAPFVATPHVLVVQWDGYVVNAAAWEAAFLDCDYIGAKWFWQPPGFRVGNGGFSLRSRRLLEALADPRIVLAENEDLTIGHAFRPLLEAEFGIRFADEAIADRFAFEAAYPIGRPFGFHGLFNFARVVPEAELAALAAQLGDAIARSPQMLQLIKNAIAQGAWRAAVALAERRCRALPDDTESAALAAHARAQGAAAPVAGRNDPCPCGSGKRYKHCHGAAGASPAAPPAADALAQRGLELHRRGDLAGAEREYRAALAASPDHAHALHYLGVIDYQRGRFTDALPLIERSAALRPDEPEFHNNLGLVLAALGRHGAAAAAYRRALAARPDHAIAWSNLGLALAAQNALPESIAAYDRALALAPGYGEAQWNRALARLKHGEWREGFADYERRLELPAFRGLPAPPTPRWRGEPLEGRTLLVVAEQGLGDAIHFLRFARDLAERGARVVVDVPRSLVRLATTVPGIAAVVARGDAWPAHDLWTPLLSVPGLLGLLAPPADARVPYLTADSARRADAAAWLAAHAPRRPRIGLSWAGARANTQDRERSCPLAQLAPLLARDDVAWVSLQKGDGEEEIAQVPAASRLALPEARNDLDGTAALIAELDLVVSVDTSLAHLAGALARPLWILVPFAGDWRWGERGATTAWYPSARLFRQHSHGDWAGVVRAVADTLSHPGTTA